MGCEVKIDGDDVITLFKSILERKLDSANFVCVIIKSNIFGENKATIKFYDKNQTVGQILDDNPDIFRFNECKFGYYLCASGDASDERDKSKLCAIRSLKAKDCGNCIVLLSRPDSG